MSAIFGWHYLDGRPVSRAGLERMATVLAHRGPDGYAAWCAGSVGLGHRMLHTTPESLSERLPFRDINGDYVITADARLDNRQELIGELRLAGLSCGAETDSQLILAAYRLWGEACAERLLGDFAFAIWDAPARTLFCARDHFGVKPFYYYFAPQRTFVFATEIKALWTVDEVPYELNEVRLGDHLADVFVDPESTFYQGIVRLPPAHSMRVRDGKVITKRYWALDPTRKVELKSNDEYAEAFREVFTESVRCRLRTSDSVGSMLSGGLDSSSITCVARNLLTGAPASQLKTFSTIFDAVPECDEREFINPVLKENGVDPHFITGNEQGPFGCLAQLHWHQDQPTFGPNFSMIWSVYQAVGAQGVRVLLDGHDGDTTVSHGERYLHEVARAGRWLRLRAELKPLAKQQGVSSWEALWAFGWKYGINPTINNHHALRFARRVWRGARRRVTSDSAEPAQRTGWRELLNPAFASQINMSERYQAWRQTTSKTARTEREAHYRMLGHPMQAFALELHDSAAGAFSIEKRYPFWDKRLVEFCLALPSQQKLNNGWTRVVMRRAMTGILPPQVQWRTAKTDFAPSLVYGLRAFEREQLDEIIIRNPGVIEGYIDISALRRAYGRFLEQESETDSTDLFAIWKSASLALWLQHRHSFKDPAPNVNYREEVVPM
ncbi:MAG: lasso peptide isopeptide bond-forming cyclase [Pyrinomonadaceae bacterium]|nr:lasso peptide isopeptide bond-forming cyclase [Pyrinomonadaceae bacterium]